MAYQLQIVLFCASLLVVNVIARPQVFNIGFHPNSRQSLPPTQPTTSSDQLIEDPISSTTAAPPVQATTPSSAYYACLARCPTTSQYNPICGSDSMNYHNIGSFNCAVMCGRSVTMVRAGTCLSLG